MGDRECYYGRYWRLQDRYSTTEIIQAKRRNRSLWNWRILPKHVESSRVLRGISAPLLRSTEGGGAYPGGFAGYLGEPSQAAAGGRPLAVVAEVGREGGEGGAVREAARAVFESVGEGAGGGLPAPLPLVQGPRTPSGEGGVVPAFPGEHCRASILRLGLAPRP